MAVAAAPPVAFADVEGPGAVLVVGVDGLGAPKRLVVG